MRIARMPLKLLALADIDENKLSFFFYITDNSSAFYRSFCFVFFFYFMTATAAAATDSDDDIEADI